MLVDPMVNEKKVPDVNVEIKKIENLKSEIREKHGLGDEGMAFKIITHNSPYQFSYEKIKGSFFDNVSSLIKGVNLKPFVDRLRK